MTFAMTFPPGTHAMWMRYWLASGGIHPDKDVSLITIPPPQMVANMKVGKMDGFCVGEPWNARAIADGIGFTAITTQQMWKDHPEKVLAFYRRIRRQKSKNRESRFCARCGVEPAYRQTGKSRAYGGSGVETAIHQHAERSHSRPHARRLRLRRRAQGKGSVLHDILRSQYEFSVEIASACGGCHNFAAGAW